MIKVCIDPHCEEVAHNIEKSEKRCRSCGMKMVEINEKTYRDKFSNNFFQFDYQTGQYFRPKIEGKQYELL